MTAFLHLALDALGRALRGPVPAVVGAYALLAALGLPAAADLAVLAAPRAVTDLGLLGLRIALVLGAIALGSRAVGPPLRAGHAEVWVVRGLSVPRWALARLTGTAIATVLLGVALTATWMGLAALLAIPIRSAIFPWTLGLALEAGLVLALGALAGTVLRGAAGPVLAGLIVVLGHLHGLWDAAGGLSGTGWVLLAVPDLARLDLHPVLFGAPTPTAGDIGLLIAYTLTWGLAATLGTLAMAARIGRG